MEHNQYLNEILFLIEKYYKENKLSKDNLDEILNLVTNLSPSVGRKSLSSISEIKNLVTPLQARGYLNTFDKYFNKHIQLNKTFKIKTSLLSQSISNKLDTVLKLIEYDNKFELLYFVNGESFFVNTEKQQLEILKGEALSDCFDNFNSRIGIDLDNNINLQSQGKKLKNTRKITIPFVGNFEDFTPSDSNYIYFMPSIIDECIYKDSFQKFTFIMCFGTENDIDTKAYYDTFQLCPPYAQGQTKC